MLSIFLKAILIGFLIAMPVGPVGLLCIKNSLAHGFRIGLAVGLGAALADALYGFLAGGGLAIISKFLLDYAYVIKPIGGLILLYLGVTELKNAKILPSKEAQVKKRGGFVARVVTLFFFTITNPATILAFVGIFAAIGGMSLTGSEILVTTFGVFIGSLLWWLILVSSASIIRHKIPDHAMIGIKIFCGSVLVCFGFWALLALS